MSPTIMEPVTFTDLRKPRGSCRAFSLLELLLVLAILSLLLALGTGFITSLRTNQGQMARQELLASLQEARARALGSEEPVWVAFSTANSNPPAESYRTWAFCEAAVDPSQPDGIVLVPVSAWEHLPQGFVFTETPPSQASAGQTLLATGMARRTVRLNPGDRASDTAMPCLAFGALGQIIFPPAVEGTLLIPITEGNAEMGRPSTRSGSAPLPGDCLWTNIAPNTGLSSRVP